MLNMRTVSGRATGATEVEAALVRAQGVPSNAILIKHASVDAALP
jgi:hypothetical protein